MGTNNFFPQVQDQYLPQPENQLDQLAKAGQVNQQRALAPLQQQQAQQTVDAGKQSLASGDIDLQQKKQQLADQQASTKTIQEWDGKNLDDLPRLLIKHGASAQAVFGMKNSILDQKTKLTKLDTDQLSNAKAQNDQILGKLQAADDVPDAQLGQYLSTISSDPAHQPHIQQLQGVAAQDPKAARAQLGIYEKSLMGGGAILEQENKRREDAIKQQTADAETLKAQTGNVENKEMQDWLTKNPGKGPSDFMAYKAKLVPAFNFNLQQQAGGGLQQNAIDQAAERYATTGQMPPTARGAAGLAQNRQIMNRAAELHPQGSITANSAEYKANADSLKNIQKQADTVNAFESTALKNLDQVVQTGAKVPDLGARFANVPVRMINEKMIGTPEMAQFKSALLTAQTEAAKVLSSANASGVLSDSARHEAQDILDGNLPYPAMVASINQLRTDMANRKQSYNEQISDIQGRLGGKKQDGAPAASSATGTHPFFDKFGGTVRPQ